MKPEFIELKLPDDDPVFIRKDRIEEIKKIDVVIFDCDGVLLDVNESYKNAVSRASSLLIEAFTGYKIPEEFFDDRLYLHYKKTGGFNNDWNHTYAYLMKTLSELPPHILEKIDSNAKRSIKIKSLADRLEFIKGNQPEIIINEAELYEALWGFTKSLTIDGVGSVDRQTAPILGENVKKALNYRARVGESIVSTLFEEIFSGKDLFEENFKMKTRFIEEKKGFIENEKIIIKTETFRKLEKFVDNRLGIASSSLANTAYHALGDIIDNFSRKSMVWHEDVEEAVKKTGRADLHKPNPYSLLRASEPYKPYQKVLYVGDTNADKIMARKASEIEPKFLFAGVYGSASLPEEAKELFIEEKSDIVTPSVNELPLILEALKNE